MDWCHRVIGEAFIDSGHYVLTFRSILGHTVSGNCLDGGTDRLWNVIFCIPGTFSEKNCHLSKYMFIAGVALPF
jgi:hypothetical protein